MSTPEIIPILDKSNFQAGKNIRKVIIYAIRNLLIGGGFKSVHAYRVVNFSEENGRDNYPSVNIYFANANYTEDSVGKFYSVEGDLYVDVYNEATESQKAFDAIEDNIEKVKNALFRDQVQYRNFFINHFNYEGEEYLQNPDAPELTVIRMKFKTLHYEPMYRTKPDGKLYTDLKLETNIK